MKMISSKSSIRTIKPNDPRFILSDGYMNSPRAGFEINEKCPSEYKMIISTCINNGWLQAVAHVHERELIFMGLSENLG